MKHNIKTIWTDVLESVKVSVSPAIFSTWFTQTHIVSLKDQDKRFLTEIGCNSSYVKDTLENRYYGLVQDTLSKILGKPCDLSFTVKENPNKVKGDALNSPLFETEKNSPQELKKLLAQAKIRLGFSFDNFAVSSSNQMAWAAAEAVNQNPGTAYNPLFIWGGVGVGKTHLMVAVGRSVLQNNPDSKVVFCTGEDFTNDIVEGIRNKTTQMFRNKYRKLNLLLIDDIQFIAGKDAVQEEFFHTFNAVTAAGGQIILTSDKHPAEISKLEERLRSRFEAGLIVDIAPPDFELRCAIAQIKATERNLDISMNVVQLVAANLDSARKIEGFLIKLMSSMKVKNADLTVDFVESLLGKGPGDSGKSIKAKPSEVVDAVSKYFSLGKRALLGDSRARPVARPRQILMYLLRTQLGIPLEEVGRLAGGRDHTTVMYAVEKITYLASSDVQTREDILGIKNTI
ncbi:MAG: chromosomal replication initiator protein DnaA [bacterium]|nr:chromosomal replication initiator protein DnaA [bacterium]